MNIRGMLITSEFEDSFVKNLIKQIMINNKIFNEIVPLNNNICKIIVNSNKIKMPI